ncbi:MAG: proton-conducting transporter membrane subunit [Candidatus Limnocylindrales bacterium]|nr:proton-conducting transporter membrane subunit [Candidatus Limnocylindrales bacterium]
MSLAIYLVVTFGFAAGAWGTRDRRPLSTVIGVGGLLAAAIAAIAIDPGEAVTMGGSGLATTAYLRLFLILGSLVGLGLSIAGLAGQTRRDVPMVTLATLGFGALTLGLADPRVAVVAGTAGGLCGALLTIAPDGDRAGATVGIRDLRAVVVAGSLAIAATAWIGRDLSQLDAQPVVFGLAYLAVALAVAVRFGAIPFHLWASRLTDAVPETALPIVTVLAAAPFAIVGLGWTDASIAPLLIDLGTERGVVLAVAVASIVLAALAALVQDELEHVVGYSIVGDAGVALLALVALDPDAWAPARTWILVLVVTRSAFAAWAGGLRIVFGTTRIIELRGWVVRSPLLAVAFGLIVVAGIGFPGLAAFEARSSLVALAIDGPLATLVLLGTLAPLAYYLRLLSVGLARPDGPPDPEVDWRPRVERLDLTALRGWWRTTWQVNRAFSSALVAVLLGLLAVATSAGAFGGAEAAAEPAPRSRPTASSAASGSDDLLPPFASDEPSFQAVPTE